MTEKERIKNLLFEYGLSAKKSFGQNFLINEGIINRIVKRLDVQQFETVIEIGPGLGSLTLRLQEQAKKLIAVDADRDMIRVLNNILQSDKVTLIQSDFLRFDPDSYSKKEDRLFVGNLPYNITSELLEYLLKKGFKKAGVMVQKEVADKLAYVPNKKDNTALGAFISSCCDYNVLTFVDRACFDPIPKVDSSFITLDYKEDFSFDIYPLYKAFFKDPNKTILNCLKQFPKYSSLINPLKENQFEIVNKRARQLTISELKQLGSFSLSLLKTPERTMIR